MQYPDRDSLTPTQAALNSAAAQMLERGKWYRFDPPAKSTAIPTGGPTVCELEECTFERGWYIGFVDGVHMFQGRPANDTRKIPVPECRRGWPKQSQDDAIDQLRSSYFGVLFVDNGVKAEVDVDQTYN